MRVRIRNADDADVRDCFMSEEEPFKLSRCDLETSYFEDLFDAIYDK